jgi:hypothetical protein
MPERRVYDLDLPEWFWRLIEEAQQDSEKMEVLLEQLPVERVREFCGHFEEAVLELHPTRSIPERNWDHETVDEVSIRVVAQGKQKYMDVWEAPDLLPEFAEAPYRNYGQVAHEVHKRKTGQGLYLTG